MTFWSWDICTGAPRPPARPRPSCSRPYCTHAAHLARPALRRRAARMAQIRAPSAEISCTSRVSRPKPVRRCLLCARAAALLCRQTPPAPPASPAPARLAPDPCATARTSHCRHAPPTAPLPPPSQTRASPTTPATASRGAAAGTSSTWTASHAGSRRARSARSATASGSLRRSRRSRPTATSTEFERGASWRPGGRACRRQRVRSAL